MSQSVKVGDTVWVFDINHREYKKSSNGLSCGGPIWRAHWRPYLIAAETSRSWVLEGWGGKIDKKTLKGNRFRVAFSQAEIDELEWIENQRPELSREVMFCDNPTKLRRISEILAEK